MSHGHQAAVDGRQAGASPTDPETGTVRSWVSRQPLCRTWRQLGDDPGRQPLRCSPPVCLRAGLMLRGLQGHVAVTSPSFMTGKVPFTGALVKDKYDLAWFIIIILIFLLTLRVKIQTALWAVGTVPSALQCLNIPSWGRRLVTSHHWWLTRLNIDVLLFVFLLENNLNIHLAPSLESWCFSFIYIWIFSDYMNVCVFKKFF